MKLKTLEFIEGRQGGIGIVEIGDEPDIKLPVLGVIDEPTARGRIVERKAEIVIHLPRTVLLSRNFPDFLDPKPIFLRLATQIEITDDLLGQRTPRAFGDQCIFRFKRNALGKARFRIALGVTTQVAGNHPAHRTIARAQHIHRRRHRENIDAQFRGLFAKPLHEPSKADDHRTGCLQLRRHQEVRQRESPFSVR